MDSSTASGGEPAVVSLALVTLGAGPALAGPYVGQNSGIATDIHDVDFVDTAHGWAVSDGGLVLATTNGGATWTKQTTPTTQVLNAVDFTDASNGWAVGGLATILHTTNGGATWTGQSANAPTATPLYDVKFLDSNNGWAVGHGDLIVHTTNGGATWTVQKSDGGGFSTLKGVAFADATHGVAVGDDNGGSLSSPYYGLMFTTANGGTTWSPALTNEFDANDHPEEPLEDVTFVDASHGWAVGEAGTVWATTNAGLSWAAQPAVAPTSVLFGVSFIDALHGWASGLDGTIISTADGGASWSTQSAPTNELLYGISYVDATHGWVAGRHGIIAADTAAPPTGALVVSPGSGPAGTEIGVTPAITCPRGSTSVDLALTDGATVVASSTVSALDSSGNWAGTLTVPGGSADGAYFVAAACKQAYAHVTGVTRQYTKAIFSVAAAANGTNGADGAAGQNGQSGAPGPAGTPGTPGAAGKNGADGASPIASTSVCKQKKSKGVTTTTCEITYKFKTRRSARIVAVVSRHGRTQAVVRGRLRGHRAHLTFRHLRAGRYRVTFRTRKSRTLLGTTTLVVTSPA